MDALKSWKRAWSRLSRAQNSSKHLSESNCLLLSRDTNNEIEKQKAEIDQTANRIMRHLVDYWVDVHDEFDRIDKEQHASAEREKERA